MSGGLNTKAIPVGSMRSLATIQRATKTADNEGGQTVVWSTYCTMWVHVSLWKGYKRVEGDQRTPQKYFQFTGQYKSGIDETMRVSLHGEIYDIVTVDNDADRNFRTILSVASGVPT